MTRGTLELLKPDRIIHEPERLMEDAAFAKEIVREIVEGVPQRVREGA